MVESDLSDYVRHCKFLRRDIEHVVHDYEVEKDGWVTHYAVDFSEIFAFVMPYDNNERAAPIADSWANDPLRQFYVLSRFFGQGSIIFPEPYALELRAFFDRLLNETYQEVNNVLLPNVTKFRKFLETNRARSLLALARAAEKRGLVDKEIESTITLFEKHAPGLVAFVRGADLPPIHRLKRLLRSKALIPLSDVVPEPPAADQTNVRKIYDALAERRQYASPASTYIDALAIEQLRLANQVLEPKRERILLVTRSPNMTAAVEDLNARDEFGGVEPFIRHPRIFSPKYRPPNGHDERSIADLRLRYDSLDVFIKVAEGAPPPTGETVPSSLEQVRQEWRDVEALATAFVEEGELKIRSSTAALSPKRIAHQLLAFLRDPEKHFYQEVTSRVERIFADLRRERDLLGVSLHSSNVAEDVPASFLYSIDFQAPFLRRTVTDFGKRWSVTLDEAIQLVRIPAEEVVSDYERLLAMSVSLGAIGRWAIAEQYADYALLFAKGLPLHEAHFLRAVCHRKNSRPGESPRASLERMRRAKERLDEAEKARQKVSTAPDVRYLKERAVLEMEWRELVNLPGNESLRDQATPELDHIEGLLLYAETVVGDDHKMRTILYNNFCYLFLGDATRLDKAAHYLELLREALDQHGPSMQWSLIQDTVIWGDFTLYPKLHGQAPPKTRLEGWVARLATLSKGPDLTPTERDTIQRHWQAVASAKPGPPLLG